MKMELLAPAGSMESLTAAVQNGADAVYLGGSSFNARRYANNFDDDALAKAMDYCHVRGVKVFVTVNTLLFDRELERALDYGAFLYRLNADAVIVQDIGLASLLHEQLPGLVLHASTQMGIHDAEGARRIGRMGLSRAVLAREVPVGEMAHIVKASSVEIEAFAHGALCMGFSGGCLFSSMAGERSGNRGTCAQPCRKRMAVGRRPGEDDYALSISDISMIHHLDALGEAGIVGIKLEGRMKRPEYVAAVTRAYRAALDGAPEEEILEHERTMLQVFNRGGSRTAHFFGDGAITGCVAQSGADEEMLRALAATYARDRRKRPVELFATLVKGAPAVLRMASEGAEITVHGEIVAQAEKSQTRERYAQQLAKLGNTPFEAVRTEIAMDVDAFLSLSAVNSLRRAACEALTAELTRKNELADEPKLPAIPERKVAARTVVSAVVRSAQQADAAFSAGADEVALEPCEYGEAAWEALARLQRWRAERKLFLALPAVIISRGEHERIKKLIESGLIDGAEANNLGQAELIEGLPLRIAGTPLNAFNAVTVNALYALGFDRVTLSVELTKPQMRDIIRTAGGALSVYQRTALMQLRHCPVKEYKGCMDCPGDPGTLVDEAGRAFPLTNIRQADGCLVRVHNCDVTDIMDLWRELPRPDAVVLRFTDETSDEVAERVNAAVRSRDGEAVSAVANATRGHWSRPVD